MWTNFISLQKFVLTSPKNTDVWTLKVASKRKLSVSFQEVDPDQKQMKTLSSRFLQYRRDQKSKNFAKRARMITKSLRNGFSRGDWSESELSDLEIFSNAELGMLILIFESVKFRWYRTRSDKNGRHGRFCCWKVQLRLLKRFPVKIHV